MEIITIWRENKIFSTLINSEQISASVYRRNGSFNTAAFSFPISGIIPFSCFVTETEKNCTVDWNESIITRYCSCELYLLSGLQIPVPRRSRFATKGCTSIKVIYIVPAEALPGLKIGIAAVMALLVCICHGTCIYRACIFSEFFRSDEPN